jgi:hypothetical protein
VVLVAHGPEFRGSGHGVPPPLGFRSQPGTPGGAASGGEPDLGVPELMAEAALLQARLDWLQSRLARLDRA